MEETGEALLGDQVKKILVAGVKNALVASALPFLDKPLKILSNCPLPICQKAHLQCLQ